MIRRSRHFIQLLHISMVMFTALWKTTEASSDSCNVTRETVEPAHSCPKTQEEWKEAAERKNCSQYADQCDEPDKLQYHCVINPYVNKTLEVCAYVQNILLGHCAEYSIVGNLIQANSKTNCATFKTNPCPIVYRSSVAFLYPGCYELVPISATTASSYVTTLSSSLSTASETGSESPDEGRANDDDDRSTDTPKSNSSVLIVTLIVIVVLLMLLLISFFILRKKNMKWRDILHNITGQERNFESSPLSTIENHVPESATDKGRAITPSGQALEPGHEKKCVVKTEDEQQELLLNEQPEEEVASQKGNVKDY